MTAVHTAQKEIKNPWKTTAPRTIFSVCDSFFWVTRHSSFTGGEKRKKPTKRSSRDHIHKKQNFVDKFKRRLGVTIFLKLRTADECSQYLQ